MGKESEDKAERILSIYTKLREGKVVSKVEESFAYGVNPRTIQRDIADIQNFLQNQNNEYGEMQEIVFDRNLGGYRMETVVPHQLQSKELLAVCKVLMESRSLIKKEMFPIINKLINICCKTEERKCIKEFIGNEMHHYVELKHGKELLDQIWKLERAVKEQCYIMIRYKKIRNHEEVVRKIKPVGVMFSEFYYYLTAFIDDIDKEKVFQHPEDPFPTIYRVDRLLEITVLNEHFSVPYRERFEEGEFRKRIQFMYGGRLHRVRFKYTGYDIDSILDRLPTAVIRSKKVGEYTIEAEVFGDGIEMWLRSQGEKIKVL